MTLAIATEPLMLVQSELLGSFEVQPEELIQFPQGLFGFPDCRSFVLVPTEREGVYWLQSSDQRALCFLLVDPFLYFDGYGVEVTPVDLAEIGADESSPVAILSIVTLPRSREEKPTANLQGPLAFNFSGRTAKQLALGETEFGVRCEFDLLRPRDGG